MSPAEENAGENKHNSFLNLPTEIKLQILRLVGKDELRRLSQTCAGLYSVTLALLNYKWKITHKTVLGDSKMLEVLSKYKDYVKCALNSS